MEHVPVVGVICLGIFVGWLVGFTLMRQEKFSVKSLAAILSIILGAAITKFLGPDRMVWWFYPIGLLVGKVIQTIIAVICGEPPKGVAYGKMQKKISEFPKRFKKSK